MTNTDTRDVVLVHRVFRREFGLLPLMVRGVADGDARRADRVARHAREMTEVLHHHHHREDEPLWPRLLQRTPVDADLVLSSASPPEQARFLRHVPRPVRLAYRLIGHRAYTRETAALRAGLPTPAPTVSTKE